MVETGILNRDLAAELVKLGHTDRLLIADAGLAIPNTTKVIDLSLDVNLPTVPQVLRVVLQHFSVEGMILSEATHQVSPTREKELKAFFSQEMPCTMVPHPYFRDELTRGVKVAIRTGDFTANSNIILISAGGDRWYCERTGEEEPCCSK